MAYGHAERNLTLIRQLEAETRKLLGSLNQLDPEQSAWLHGVTGGRGGQRVADDADPGVVPGALGEHQSSALAPVEWHLGNVFAKPGITFRKDLR